MSQNVDTERLVHEGKPDDHKTVSVSLQSVQFKLLVTTY